MIYDLEARRDELRRQKSEIGAELDALDRRREAGGLTDAELDRHDELTAQDEALFDRIADIEDAILAGSGDAAVKVEITAQRAALEAQMFGP